MNFWRITIAADPEARGKLWASETNLNVNSCIAAFLGVLDAVGVANFLAGTLFDDCVQWVCIRSG